MTVHNDFIKLERKLLKRIRREVDGVSCNCVGTTTTSTPTSDTSSLTAWTGWSYNEITSNTGDIETFQAWSATGSFSGGLSSSTDIQYALDNIPGLSGVTGVSTNQFTSHTESNDAHQLSHFHEWSGVGAYSASLSSATNIAAELDLKLNITDFGNYTGSSVSGFGGDIGALITFSAASTAVTTGLQETIGTFNSWSGTGSYSGGLSSATEISSQLNLKTDLTDFGAFTADVSTFSASTDARVGLFDSWSATGAYSGNLSSATYIQSQLDVKADTDTVNNALDLKVDEEPYGEWTGTTNKKIDDFTTWSATGAFSASLSSATYLETVFDTKLNTDDFCDMLQGGTCVGADVALIYCEQISASTSVSASTLNVDGTAGFNGLTKFNSKVDFKGSLDIGSGEQVSMSGADGQLTSLVTDGDCTFTGGSVIVGDLQVRTGITLNSENATPDGRILFKGGIGADVDINHDHVNGEFNLVNTSTTLNVSGDTRFARGIDVYDIDDQSGDTLVFSTYNVDSGGTGDDHPIGPADIDGTVYDVVHSPRSWTLTFSDTFTTQQVDARAEGTFDVMFVSPWALSDSITGDNAKRGIPVPIKSKLVAIACSTVIDSVNAGIGDPILMLQVGIVQPEDVNTGGTNPTVYDVRLMEPTIDGAYLSQVSQGDTEYLTELPTLKAGALVQVGARATAANYITLSSHFHVTLYFEEVNTSKT